MSGVEPIGVEPIGRPKRPTIYSQIEPRGLACKPLVAYVGLPPGVAPENGNVYTPEEALLVVDSGVKFDTVVYNGNLGPRWISEFCKNQPSGEGVNTTTTIPIKIPEGGTAVAELKAKLAEQDRALQHFAKKRSKDACAALEVSLRASEERVAKLNDQVARMRSQLGQLKHQNRQNREAKEWESIVRGMDSPHRDIQPGDVFFVQVSSLRTAEARKEFARRMSLIEERTGAIVVMHPFGPMDMVQRLPAEMLGQLRAYLDDLLAAPTDGGYVNARLIPQGVGRAAAAQLERDRTHIDGLIQTGASCADAKGIGEALPGTFNRDDDPDLICADA